MTRKRRKIVCVRLLCAPADIIGQDVRLATDDGRAIDCRWIKRMQDFISTMADLGLQWGAFFAVAGGVAYAFSPVYKGLTVQFKTYVLSNICLLLFPHTE
jgi:hypothetical protein